MTITKRLRPDERGWIWLEPVRLWLGATRPPGGLPASGMLRPRHRRGDRGLRSHHAGPGRGSASSCPGGGPGKAEEEARLQAEAGVSRGGGPAACGGPSRAEEEARLRGRGTRASRGRSSGRMPRHEPGPKPTPVRRPKPESAALEAELKRLGGRIRKRRTEAPFGNSGRVSVPAVSRGRPLIRPSRRLFLERQLDRLAGPGRVGRSRG